MKNLQFPLNLTFKIGTLSNDFLVNDASGATVAYVRQKIMKLIEEVQVYTNDDRAELMYTIKANKWIDFSASYMFVNKQGLDCGRVARKGWASIWKAHYEIYNENQQNTHIIREENPWAKVFDSILTQIPFLGILSGYLFHPTYAVLNTSGDIVARLSKMQSFFGRRFVIDKLAETDPKTEERILLSLMMMILLERQRG